MARGVNKAIIVGNLGKDPEVRYTAGGAAIANITVATSDVWKDKTTGENQERTEWHRIVFFGRLAEIAGEYLAKGSQVYIEGRIQTRKWKDQAGQDRYTTEIVANDLQMLGGRKEGGGGVSASPGDARAYAKASGAREYSGGGGGGGAPEFDDFDDDIPFATNTPGVCFPGI